MEMSVSHIFIALGILCAIALVFGTAAAFAGIIFPAKKTETAETEKGTENVANSVAVVRCKGSDRTQRYTYDGPSDCNIAIALSAGPIGCANGCLGLGTCVGVCPEKAISVKDTVAFVDKEKCTGCGICIDFCPRGVIALVPKASEQTVLCSSTLQGSELRKNCDAGCIGCMLCVKTCKYNAITVSDNLAVIDSKLCKNCGECADVCPRGIISTERVKEEPKEEVMDEAAYLKSVIKEARETETGEE